MRFHGKGQFSKASGSESLYTNRKTQIALAEHFLDRIGLVEKSP